MSFFQLLRLLRVTHGSEGAVSLSALVAERTLLRLTVSREARECCAPDFPPRRQTLETTACMHSWALWLTSCVTTGRLRGFVSLGLCSYIYQGHNNSTYLVRMLEEENEFLPSKC